MTLPDTLQDKDLFFNRELNWLEFERRILAEARREDVPLLERLKFLSIFSTNLDEFFMVRLAGLQRQTSAGHDKAGPDGLTPQETFSQAYEVSRKLTTEQYDCFNQEVLPKLEQHEIRFVPLEHLDETQAQQLHAYFRSDIFPLLTPVAVDPSHPFPHLNNKTLNVAVILADAERAGSKDKFAVVQVPTVVSRFIRVPANQQGEKKRNHFILLEDLIGTYIHELFTGFRIQTWAPFRITRDSDLTLEEQEEIDDLLTVIRKKLVKQKLGMIVRVEVRKNISDKLLQFLKNSLDVEDMEFMQVDGPIHLGHFMELLDLVEYKSLRDATHSGVEIPGLGKSENLFARIRRSDVLMLHPYDNFETVVNLLERAAEDPKVLAIKQTLYRAGGDSRMIDALIRAAGNGKQVSVLIELKARFDEQNNIIKANELEKAGVHVVYGIVGLKIHCKSLMIIRKEGTAIKRYVHLSTGNYNPTTSRIYFDIGYLTCREDFGEDATTLFNFLTGYAKNVEWKHLSVSPKHLKKSTLQLIKDEVKSHKTHGNGRIVLKMNALVDADTIRELYAASQAGVKIDLIVRGICCLRPGVPGVSDNISVVAHLDKYLEHARVFYFHNNGEPQVLLSSADWMPRNFYSRVEVMFPILDNKLKQTLMDVLELQLHDNTHSHELKSDGTYARRVPVAPELALRQQTMLEQLATRQLSRKAALDLVRKINEASGKAGVGILDMFSESA